MKKFFEILALLMLSAIFAFNAHANHTANLNNPLFSTRLYFEDSQGNKDTLIIGYSTSATMGIDEEFAELNFGYPFTSTGFGAFIVNQDWEHNQEFFFLKKQIVGIEQNYVANSAIPIIFSYESLPVTISWDQQEFSDASREFSLITDWPPFCWFDVGIGWDIIFARMKDQNQIIIPKVNDSEVLELMKQHDFKYTFDGVQHHFKTLYVAFGNDAIMSVQEPEVGLHTVKLSPNPVMDIMKIEVPDELRVNAMSIHTLCGRLVRNVDPSINTLNCEGLTPGVYVLAVTSDVGISHQKFIKLSQ